jgi:hypothetical protein
MFTITISIFGSGDDDVVVVVVVDDVLPVIYA